MPARALLYSVAIILLAATAVAQQRPVFDPDDFVDPRDLDGPIFISRLVAVVASRPTDDYRPLHQNAGFLEIANSFYRSNVQFDYKHSEAHGTGDNGPAHVKVCQCDPPLYFPTAPSPRATPDPPLPAPKDTLQAAWYYPSLFVGPGGFRMMQRIRLTVSRQRANSVVTLGTTDHVVSRLSGREQSIGIDADTYVRIAGHEIFGSLLAARTVRTGTTADRSQNELTYVSRFPAVALPHQILVRATVTVGGVSGRGASGISIVNPAFEAYWRHMPSRTNVHLVWSPQATRDGVAGWKRNSQIVFYVDRMLYMKRFGLSKPSDVP